MNKTIEEKAKAYDELIVKAKLMIQERGNEPDGASMLSNLFPELAESEDEKIRKDSIKYLDWEYHHLSNDIDRMKIEKCIAWLEKQGEQKPSWSEEDEDVINHLLAICAGAKKYRQFAGCLQEDITKYQTWLKFLKERVQPQPKQEWSEYDKIQLSEAIQMIEANGTWIRSEDAVKKVSNWLKSLRPQSH